MNSKLEKLELVYQLNEQQKQRWESQTPPELKARNQWVVWRLKLAPKDDKWKKVPCNAVSGKWADPTDDSIWLTFEGALDACYQGGANKYQGIGFVLSAADEYAGIDLDRCRDKSTGTIEPWAQRIIERFDSYTEVSPSGTGIRIFVRGKLPPRGRRKGDIEVYDDVRFVTLTAHHLFGSKAIEQRQEELCAWHAEVFPPQLPAPPLAANRVRSCAASMSDDEVLRKAFKAKNGAETRRLYGGDTSSQNNNHSSADFSLLKRFAFYTQDAAQLDRLFRTSALFRPKWDERRADHLTYGQLTIQKVLQDCHNIYSPSQPRSCGKSLDGVVASGNCGAEREAFHLQDPPVGSVSELITKAGSLQELPQVDVTHPGGDGIEAQSDLTPGRVGDAEAMDAGAANASADVGEKTAVEKLSVDTPFAGALTSSEDSSSSAPTFRYLRPLSYLDSLPPREWLIDDVLICNTSSAIIGAYGCGKTFVMLDMAFCIACGIPYHGHKVKQGPVVIIEAEGVGGLLARKQAWLSRHPEADLSLLEQNVWLVTEAVQFCEDDEIEALLNDLEQLPTPPLLTVIDTLARSLVGKDENNQRDMGIFVHRCDRIRNATGGNVMVLHHANKSGGIRGSTVLPAAIDTVVLCSIDSKKSTITMYFDKQKDKKGDKRLKFSLSEDQVSGGGYLTLTDNSHGAFDESGDLNAKESQVIGALKEADDEWHGLKDIGTMVPDIPESTLQKIIRALVARGRLETIGEGNRMRYRLPEDRACDLD